MWAALQEKLETFAPDTNPSKFVRKRLFDPVAGGVHGTAEATTRRWSDKFAGNRWYPDCHRRRKPEVSAPAEGSAKIRGGDRLRRRSRRDAAGGRGPNAKSPEDLLPVIDSEGLQLLTPRENRIQIEALRKADRDYIAKAAEADLSRSAPGRATEEALRRYLDEALHALDKSRAENPDYF